MVLGLVPILFEQVWSLCLNPSRGSHGFGINSGNRNSENYNSVSIPQEGVMVLGRQHFTKLLTQQECLNPSRGSHGFGTNQKF